MINWKVRLRNKLWLASFTSQTALVVQVIIAGLVSLGVLHVNIQEVDHWIKVLLGMVDTVLVYLSFLGIVQDPTTKGIGDSERVREYIEPK